MGEGAEFLANPSGQCCLQGSLHEGETRRSHTTIAGVDTYVSRPASKKRNGHILLYFPDVWGFFLNGFLVMDRFADSGYLVLGLDCVRGVGGISYPNLSRRRLTDRNRIQPGNIEIAGELSQILTLIMKLGKEAHYICRRDRA